MLRQLDSISRRQNAHRVEKAPGADGLTVVLTISILVNTVGQTEPVISLRLVTVL